MSYHNNPRIVNDGLLLNFDASKFNNSIPITDNLMIYNFWSVGNSSTGFSANDSNDTVIEVDVDPYERRSIIWKSVNNDVSSGADGGWNSSAFNIDHTKKYRFTYWFKVKNKGITGTLYFGLYGYDASSNIGVKNVTTGTNNTNPYFSYPTHNNSIFPEDEWIMAIFYVYPSSTTAPHTIDADTGFYLKDGTKLSNPSSGNIDSGAIWNTTNTRALHRTYLYYSTDPNVNIHWYYPRVDEVNGSEPTITEMLNYPSDSLVDSINSGHNMTLFNKPTYNSDNGGYFDFNGSNQFLAGPNYSALDQITNQLTIQTWIKTDALSQFGHFFEKGNVNTQYSLFQENSNIVFRTKPSSGSYTSLLVSSSNIDTNNWWCITATYDGVNKKIYINDTLKGTESFTSNLATSNNGMSIGKYGGATGSSGYYYNGKISSVRVYNKALSSTEIIQNFNAHKARFNL